MRVLTTDLDRTFIFSKQTVSCSEHELVCIEKLEGQDLSYISKNVQMLMNRLDDTQLIIPVTTRSLTQYERIEVFQSAYNPKFAIAANGGIVLKNGKRDTQWDEIVTSNLQESMSFEQMSKHFAQDWQHPMFRSIASADQLFYVLMLIEEKIDKLWLEALSHRMQKVGWKSYINGRKFYVLPKKLTKQSAVQYVLQQLEYSVHFAAGDSIMDLGMLQLAEKAFTPKHGELYKNYTLDEHIYTPTEIGVSFTENMLQKFLVY